MDVNNIRKDFPILQRQVNGKPLIYLDNAATSQKPNTVIDAVSAYYKTYNANVHRGIHTLSEQATDIFETTRKNTARFINAANTSEIIFTKSATEGLNLLAHSLTQNLNEGDEILLTEMEHHSNIIPWQMAAQRHKLKLKYITVNDKGYLDTQNLGNLITERTKILSLVHVSNVLGTINPVKDIIKKAKRANPNVIAIIDACQSVPHIKTSVISLGSDFIVFSAHKALAPTGVGILWGKKEHLEKIPPFLGGGSMIVNVEKDHSTYAPPPQKFEAGTQNIAGVIGLNAAIEYLTNIGMDNIRQHSMELARYAIKKISALDFVELLPPLDHATKTAVIGFNVKDVHPHDTAAILDSEGIAVRSGHHCCQLLHKKLGIKSSVRASFYLYNTKEEVDKLVEAIYKVKKVFKQ